MITQVDNNGLNSKHATVICYDMKREPLEKYVEMRL
jgi:hypothetical protein